MTSTNKQATIVFNGEIYNYRELRKQLEEEGVSFQTNSDTEVLLNLYLSHGPAMLSRLNGMFAFVIHDTRRNCLFGARDRLGLKPFYYTQNGNGFFFASEIKAFTASGIIPFDPDQAGIALYLTRRYIPGERTAHKGVCKLRPGHSFVLDSDKRLTISRYWALPESTIARSDEEILHTFSELLASSVSYRLIADVPLGIFLSGGIDSTAIAATMADIGCSRLKSFTFGFTDGDPETVESLRTANHFNFRPDIQISNLDDVTLYPRLMHHMDAPYGDPILLPLFLLSRQASKSVKVVLSGDGADETQHGYIHHEALSRLFGIARRFPRAAMALGSTAVGITPVSFLDKFFNYPESMGTQGRERLALLLRDARRPGRCYHSFTNLFSREELLALGGPKLRQGVEEAWETFLGPEEERINNSETPLREIYRQDLSYWLPDNILTKYDKMTMAASVEGRAPFLDHRLVEFLASLPTQSLIRNGRGKAVLSRHFENTVRIPGRQVKSKRAFYFPMTGKARAKLDAMVEAYASPKHVPNDILDGVGLQNFLARSSREQLLNGKRLFALAGLGMWLTPEDSGAKA